MSRFNTGNPLGSGSPLDLDDNAKNMDLAMNSDELRWSDRFGRDRKTWAAIEQGIEEQLIAGGQIFPDELTGRDAVADGQYFYAESDDPGVSKTLWQRISSSESRFVADDPSAAFVALVAAQSRQYAGLDAQTDEYDYVIADENELAAFAIKNTGESAFGDVELFPSSLEYSHVWSVQSGNGELLLGVNRRLEFESKNIAQSTADYDSKEWGLVDDNGNSAFYITPDGRSDLSLTLSSANKVLNLSAQIKLSQPQKILPDEGAVFYPVEVNPSLTRVLSDINGITRPYLHRTDPDGQGYYIYDTDQPIELILSSGQSLAMGGGAGFAPVDERIYTVAPPAPQNCLMLNTGMRGLNRLPDPPTLEQMVDFVPAREEYSGATQGETQGSGVMSWLYRTEQLNAERSTTRAYVAAGRGGSSIDELDKAGGGTIYPDSIATVEKMVEIAGIYGKEARLNYITWSQGQGDRGATREYYKNKLLTLAADYRADLPAVLPVDNGSINFVCTQMAASTTGSPSEVSLAYLDASDEDPLLFVACPEYPFMYVDNVHLIARDYAVLGEYVAKAIRAIQTTGDYKPLRPSNIVRDGRYVTVDFDSAVGGLSLDTQALPHAENYGFVYDDDENSARIVSVTTAGSSVFITLNVEPTGTEKRLSYAWGNGVTMPEASQSGAWGNLRDNDPSPSFMQLGRTLHNWCVIFNETIS